MGEFFIFLCSISSEKSLDFSTVVGLTSESEFSGSVGGLHMAMAWRQFRVVLIDCWSPLQIHWFNTHELIHVFLSSILFLSFSLLSNSSSSWRKEWPPGGRILCCLKKQMWKRHDEWRAAERVWAEQEWTEGCPLQWHSRVVLVFQSRAYSVVLWEHGHNWKTS